VVTGDVTQVDLPTGTTSGLRVVEEILGDVDDVAFCRLGSADVVRHRLVGQIIDAYARWDAPSGGTSRPGDGDGAAVRDRRGRGSGAGAR
jgi:phosphate starvation-inducible protein PhoH and related proteins